MKVPKGAGKTLEKPTGGEKTEGRKGDTCTVVQVGKSWPIVHVDTLGKEAGR